MAKAVEFRQLSVSEEKTFSLQNCKILCLARKHFLPATPDKYIGCHPGGAEDAVERVHVQNAGGAVLGGDGAALRGLMCTDRETGESLPEFGLRDSRERSGVQCLRHAHHCPQLRGPQQLLSALPNLGRPLLTLTLLGPPWGPPVTPASQCSHLCPGSPDHL